MELKPNLENILFIDIETVAQWPDFEQMPAPFQKLWDKKSSFFRKENETASTVYARTGIFAEFAKIICISVGYLYKFNGEFKIRIKSFAGHDEIAILTQFSELLLTSFSKKEHLLCAHNGKEFDFPFLGRRYLVNGLELPSQLNHQGKKPWEIPHLDTLELWKFGDYKHYTSLELLTTIFNIPTPKDDIDGSQIYTIYWTENDLPRIVTYCQKDVLAVAQVYLRMRNIALLNTDSIQIIEHEIDV